MRRKLAGLLATGCALGCTIQAPDPWNLEALGRANPALAAISGHRLKDVRPYTLAAAGRLTFFLCRWPDGARIPVAIDATATLQEQRAIEAALDAWEGSGLGVRFERRERLARPHGVDIRVREEFHVGSSNTIADCRVDPAELQRDSGPLTAHLVFASIHLAENDPHLTGRALHELGHALGFQGHPRGGDTVMSPGMKAARLAGERVRKGTLRGDAALSALYALPSGTVLSRHALPPERTRPVDRLAERAARAGWSGPFVRVGDKMGRFFWRDARGDSIAITLTGLTASRKDPLRLELTPDPRAERELLR